MDTDDKDGFAHQAHRVADQLQLLVEQYPTQVEERLGDLMPALQAIENRFNSEATHSDSSLEPAR